MECGMGIPIENDVQTRHALSLRSSRLSDITTSYFSYLAIMKLDLLAIGVHPDDVELGCSGTLINEIKRGKKIGIVDLTQGELSTRGTVETRYQESANAAMIIGAVVRENLKMRDGFFRNDEAHQ